MDIETVEQLAWDSVPDAPIQYNNEESFAWRSGWISGFPKGYQAGQSAAQDAIPQEGETDEIISVLYDMRSDFKEGHWRYSIINSAVDKMRSLDNELSTLRSSLSAAQLQLDKNKIRIEHLTWEREEYRKNLDKKEEENKRLREGIK